jgi:hypothetical protein
VWPCSARSTPRRSSPPRRACTAWHRPHCRCGAAPPSLHHSRETFLPCRRAPPPRRSTGTQTPPGPRPHAWSYTGRSKRCPHPPPPRNRMLPPLPPQTRTLRRPCVERWPGLVTVTVPMLPWSVPLWMDDSTPSRQ